MARLLQTLAQISDLHLRIIDDQGVIVHPDWLCRVWAQCATPLDSLLGHHEHALDAVEERFDEGDPPVPVVTGDLTSYGHRDQFVAATRFRASGPAPGVPSLQINNWPAHGLSGSPGTVAALLRGGRATACRRTARRGRGDSTRTATPSSATSTT